MPKKKWSILSFIALIWIIFSILGYPFIDYLYYKVFEGKSLEIGYYLFLLGLPLFNLLIGNVLAIIALVRINSKNLRGRSVATAAFAGSYLLYEIMSRIPFLRWCVLGIKKEKKE